MNDNFTIIIADDDSDDQEFLISTIQEINPQCNILCVPNGEELIAVLWGDNKNCDPAFQNPDLIFLDLNMPLLDGYESLRLIRAKLNLKSVPVFVLTTSEFEYDRIKSVAYGANGFYSKPMTPGGIKNIVMEIFSKCDQLVPMEIMKKRVS